MGKREEIELKMIDMTKEQKLEYLDLNMKESDDAEDDLEFKVTEIKARRVIYKTLSDEIKAS